MEKFSSEQELSEHLVGSLLMDHLHTFSSIQRGGREGLESLRTVRRIVVTGSSCNGKSTIVDGLRAFFEGNESVFFPCRYITRPQRANDNTVENVFTTTEELREKLRVPFVDLDGPRSVRRVWGPVEEQNAKVDAAWRRQMEGDRVEQYAFEGRVEQPEIRVYSANNALAQAKAVEPDTKGVESLSNDTLWIAIHAPEDVRAARMKSRSPDLSDAEVAYRLGDRSESMIPFAHLVVHNYGPAEAAVVQEVASLISSYVLPDAQKRAAAEPVFTSLEKAVWFSAVHGAGINLLRKEVGTIQKLPSYEQVRKIAAEIRKQIELDAPYRTLK